MSVTSIHSTSSHALIRSWQAFLNGQGFSAVSADGYWGNHTITATKAFQKANNLTADGIVGPDSSSIPGVGHCDRSVFNGSADELKTFWEKHAV